MNCTSSFLARLQAFSAAKHLAVTAVLLLTLAGIGPRKALATEATSAADLKYLPDDCDVVVTADVNGMIASNAGQKIKTGAADLLASVTSKMPKDSKIMPKDVGRVTFGVLVQGKKGAGVLHMTRAVSEADFPDAEKATKKTVGQYTLYVKDNQAFCMIDDRTLAVGDDETLAKVLERNGPAKLGDDLKAAMGDVDFTKSFAAAMAMKNLMGAAGGAAPPGADGVRTVSFQIEVADDIKIKAVAACKDAATAEQMKQMADGVLASVKVNAAQMPPPVTKLINALETSKSGSSIGATLAVDVDTVLALVKIAGARAGGPGGPAPSAE